MIFSGGNSLVQGLLLRMFWNIVSIVTPHSQGHDGDRLLHGFNTVFNQAVKRCLTKGVSRISALHSPPDILRTDDFTGSEVSLFKTRERIERPLKACLFTAAITGTKIYMHTVSNCYGTRINLFGGHVTGNVRMMTKHSVIHWNIK